MGHDPDFSELVSELVGAPIPMRKGTLARIDVPPHRGEVSRTNGTLAELLVVMARDPKTKKITAFIVGDVDPQGNGV